jgi:sodium-dependent dicarboxylate transporter 2/3/5
MVVWWVTEAVPLAATSLLPLTLFPLLGVASPQEAAAPYAHQLIFLFLAGFLLAAALQAWNAHTRIAYAIVSRIGYEGKRVVLGIMLATAFLSMWISNTATTAMMYPIALAIGALLGQSDEARTTRTALMLGVAYAASIGGMATLIGTPPNLIFSAFVEQSTGRVIGFGQFMTVGLPTAVVLLPLCWVLLVYVAFRRHASIPAEAEQVIARRRAALGELRGGEAKTLAVFVLTASAWLLRAPKDFGVIRVPGLTDLAPGISDATIGIAGAVLLFLLHTAPKGAGEEPRRPLLTWEEARSIPWGVLLLFGGGLSLAAAMESSGLTSWIAQNLEILRGLPTPLLLLGLAITVLALGELASNTALAAMAMPLVASLAVGIGQPPLLLLLVTTLAASTGFALPIATPPNAIVFGSGQVRVRDMVRAGLMLDVAAVIVVVVVVTLLFPLLFG